MFRFLTALVVSASFATPALAALYGQAMVLPAANGQDYVLISCYEVDGNNSTFVGSVTVSTNSPSGATATCNSVFGLVVSGDDPDIIGAHEELMAPQERMVARPR